MKTAGCIIGGGPSGLLPSQLLHTIPDSSAYDRKLQPTDLEYLFSPDAAQSSRAENCAGLPF